MAGRGVGVAFSSQLLITQSNNKSGPNQRRAANRFLKKWRIRDIEGEIKPRAFA
jgi:hypothetical protein